MENKAPGTTSCFYLFLIKFFLVSLLATSFTFFNFKMALATFDITNIKKDFKSLYCPPYQFDFYQTTGTILITAGLINMDKTIFDSLQKPLADTYFKTDISPLLNDWSLPLFVAYSLLTPENEEYKYINGITFAYTFLNTEILKTLIGDSRPSLGEEHFIGPTLQKNYDAMPSGHTAIAFSLATVLSKENPKYQWLYFSTATVIGILRVIDEKHWPSNVFAGAAVGIWCGNRVWQKKNPLQITLNF